MRRAVERRRREGSTLKAAFEHVAADCPWSAASLSRWHSGRVGRPGLRDYPKRLWPMAMAPRHVGCTVTAECSPEAWEYFKADYLRAERPSAAQCHRDLQRVAAGRDWAVPRSPSTLLRRLRREVPVHAITLARNGKGAVKRLMPAQVRDREGLRSMAVVSVDGHRWDDRVRWRDGSIARPMMVCWECWGTGKILSRHIGREETARSCRLSCAQMLERYGVPGEVIADNGRGIAAYELCGRSPTRKRFGRGREGEPVGLLTELVGERRIHWTNPYSGQSKHIERAFRDFAGSIAKDPRLAGCYCGPQPRGASRTTTTRARRSRSPISSESSTTASGSTMPAWAAAARACAGARSTSFSPSATTSPRTGDSPRRSCCAGSWTRSE